MNSRRRRFLPHMRACFFNSPAQKKKCPWSSSAPVLPEVELELREPYLAIDAEPCRNNFRLERNIDVKKPHCHSPSNDGGVRTCGPSLCPAALLDGIGDTDRRVDAIDAGSATSICIQAGRRISSICLRRQGVHSCRAFVYRWNCDPASGRAG